jgi:glycosyltransferase involved in cell wall biosynthesis
VWLVHDVIRQPQWLAILRACRSVITLAVAPSEAVARPLREHGLHVCVVRNGTPWPVAPVHPSSSETVVIGATALLTAWKGQDVLLEAVARMSRRDVVVELLGGSFPKDTPYVERLRRRAAQPDLDGRVRFLGHVDDSVERMRHWSVAVMASVDPEAAPLALLEAMSIGLPIVITDHGGGPEVLHDGGLLVPPGDPDALAAAIERLVDDPDLQASCREAGRRAIRNGLTLQIQQNNLLRVLGDVVDACQSRPKARGITRYKNE